jgi:AcrR family transcriptional regulator
MSVMPDDECEPIIWMRPEATGRGRSPAYSRAQIATAAIGIADTEGIDAVSMRRVAADIGAGTMSLYRYVHSKEELHALMADQAVDPSDMPTHIGWEHALWQLAHESRNLVLRHPWFPALARAISFPGPRMALGLERMMSYLDGLELDVDEMLEILVMVQNHAFGFAQGEVAEAQALIRSGLTREQWQQRQGPYVQHLMESGDFPYLSRIIVEAETPHLGPDAVFDRSLTRLLSGIGATIATRRPTT